MIFRSVCRGMHTSPPPLPQSCSIDSISWTLNEMQATTAENVNIDVAGSIHSIYCARTYKYIGASNKQANCAQCIRSEKTSERERGGEGERARARDTEWFSDAMAKHLCIAFMKQHCVSARFCCSATKRPAFATTVPSLSSSAHIIALCLHRQNAQFWLPLLVHQTFY